MEDPALIQFVASANFRCGSPIVGYQPRQWKRPPSSQTSDSFFKTHFLLIEKKTWDQNIEQSSKLVILFPRSHPPSLSTMHPASTKTISLSFTKGYPQPSPLSVAGTICRQTAFKNISQPTVSAAVVQKSRCVRSQRLSETKEKEWKTDCACAWPLSWFVSNVNSSLTLTMSKTRTSTTTNPLVVCVLKWIKCWNSHR